MRNDSSKPMEGENGIPWNDSGKPIEGENGIPFGMIQVNQ
jgi:hypothetical protein